MTVERSLVEEQAIIGGQKEFRTPPYVELLTIGDVGGIIIADRCQGKCDAQVAGTPVSDSMVSTPLLGGYMKTMVLVLFLAITLHAQEVTLLHPDPYELGAGQGYYGDTFTIEFISSGWTEEGQITSIGVVLFGNNQPTFLWYNGNANECMDSGKMDIVMPYTDSSGNVLPWPDYRWRMQIIFKDNRKHNVSFYANVWLRYYNEDLDSLVFCTGTEKNVFHQPLSLPHIHGLYDPKGRRIIWNSTWSTKRISFRFRRERR